MNNENWRTSVRRFYRDIGRERHGSYNPLFSPGRIIQNKIRRMVIRIIENECYNWVLDVGCGSGRYGRMVSSQGSNYVGLDSSPEMLRQVRKVVDVLLVVGCAEFLPFKERVFDCVLCIDVLHHLKGKRSKECCLYESIRVLREEGRMLLEIKNRLQPAYDLLYSLFCGSQRPPIVEPADPRTIRETLVALGLVEIEFQGIIPDGIGRISPIFLVVGKKLGRP